ncbi:major facilitator superfamily domain-containing protein [Zychaea mexicana]|uniref:major facilitator superfamily domain-containing protein n=1 Tax=Zychaea mexicana TaxID=64656 RepID=UPI0022FE1444|nr:major facilitator superfamily domain-containing protein [Zychaea mexicana]KAI9498884.1 major facilitator superfamily domain-containing protein [Zychaea mexicana]
MKFFAKELIVDQHGKATNFRLHSFQFPHMRALHFAWFSFLVAFMSWYAIPPIGYHIAQDLNIPQVQVYDANMVSVAITIVARLVIGPLCERFGPRRMMCVVLVCGAIPCGMTGLISSGTGLIVIRAIIGILGGAFVPCQFWTTQMFAPSIVGTANSLSAGWGNMGAGITYLVMPAIYDGIAAHTSNAIAWRVTFVVPAGICIVVAIINYFFATDTPHGDWLVLRRQEAEGQYCDSSSSSITSIESPDQKMEIGVAIVGTAEEVNNIRGDKTNDDESIVDVKRNQSFGETMLTFGKVFCKPPVLIMIVHYACSLGAELAIDNVIGDVFREHYNLAPSTAAYIGSVFGLMNLFSRVCGGLLSDYFAHRFHLPGRILAHFVLMTLEGIFLIGFSFGLDTNMPTAIVLMIFFSFFVQAVCGSTFGIVPFVDPLNNGKVMGMVGAGGNIGGIVFNLMFRQFQPHFHKAFLCLGCIALGAGVIGNLMLRVQGKGLLHLFGGRYA